MDLTERKYLLINLDFTLRDERSIQRLAEYLPFATDEELLALNGLYDKAFHHNSLPSTTQDKVD